MPTETRHIGTVPETQGSGAFDVYSQRYNDGEWYYGFAAGSPGNDTGELELTPEMRDEMIRLLNSIKFKGGE